MDRNRDVEKFLNHQDVKPDCHVEMYKEIAWETIGSYKFKDDDGKEVWLPKSQVDVRELSNGVEVEIPIWLAKEKGLI